MESIIEVDIVDELCGVTNVKNQRKIWRDEFWKELEEVNHHHHFWVWFNKLRNG